MALLRLVKFRWVRDHFDENEAETVFFSEAKPVVFRGENSPEVLLRMIDGENRIWSTLGLNVDDLDQLIEQLQTARDDLDDYLETVAKALLKKYDAEGDHAA
ncbi:hypothetical protein DLREEDagrD3_28640 [Denitratisoma sp. agr-D3]